MEVKFCGTRSLTDVNIARSVGATEIGVIVRPPHEIPRRQPGRISHTIDVQIAGKIMREAEDTLTTVLVPRSRDFSTIASMVEALQPQRLQIGEMEDPRLTAALAELPGKPALAQVIHVDEETNPEVVDDFLGYADVIHLDSAGEQPGGNGVTHDWEISRALAERARAAGKSVLLAGGLNANNVGLAIAKVKPDGVDVETGIKSEFGFHNHRLGQQFIEAVSQASDNGALLP